MKSFWSLMLSVSALFYGCKEEPKRAGGGAAIVAQPYTEQNAMQNTAVSNGGRTFYAGFDGVNDYSLLLPGYRDYTISDPTVAELERKTVTLPEETVDEIIAEIQSNDANFSEELASRFREFIGREHSAYVLKPLRAGNTSLMTSRGGRGGRDVWGGGAVAVQLVVNSYQPDQYEAGKQRYTSEGSGLLKACASCHASGDEGAPPHELGNIKEISDEMGLQWITTGAALGRVAKITHTWEFENDAQKKGILPYLRSKASKDLETFTKLVIEERMQNFDFNRRPQRP